jgi:type IV secretion system protein TrbF
VQPTIELKRSSRSARQKAADPTSHTIQGEPQPYNPYLTARREWDERYGDLVARAKKSDRIALICASLALVAMTIAGVLAIRGPRIVPIPVDLEGHYIGSASTARSLVVTEMMKRSALSDWVTYLRTVTSDQISQRWAIEKVYAMMSSGSSAQTVVSDFYRNDPPQQRAQRENVHLEVNSILPTSDKTYEVEWLETTRDLGGRITSQQRLKGIFTFVISSNPPPDERLARLNPIGLYINNASWSKVL